MIVEQLVKQLLKLDQKKEACMHYYDSRVGVVNPIDVNVQTVYEDRKNPDCKISAIDSGDYDVDELKKKQVVMITSIYDKRERS